MLLFNTAWEMIMSTIVEIKIDKVYDRYETDDGIVCIFPKSGNGSLQDLRSMFGENEDVFIRACQYYLVGENTNRYALEKNSYCYLGNSDGIQLVEDGYKYEDDGCYLIATRKGWELVMQK